MVTFPVGGNLDDICFRDQSTKRCRSASDPFAVPGECLNGAQLSTAYSEAENDGYVGGC